MQNQIPKNWQKVKMEEIVDSTDYVANGSFASLKQNVAYKNEEDFALLIRSVDLKNGLSSRKVFINQNAYNFLKKTKLFGGEVIVTNVGEYTGEVFRCPKLDKPMSLGPNVVLLRAKNGNNNFIYYLLKSPFGQHKLHTIISGSGQPKFNKTDLRSLVFTVPLEDSQLKIASVLSTFDDKIEINNKIAKTLEEIAQALFKEWLTNNKDKNLKSTDLFDVAEVTYGYPFKSDLFNDVQNGIPVIRIRNLDGSSTSTCTTEIVEEKYKVKNGDILIGMDGEFYLRRWTGGDAYLNQRVVRLRPKKVISWFHLFLSLIKPTRGFQGSISGTTVAHLSDKDLKSIEIVISSNETYGRLSAELDNLYWLSIKLSEENKKLADLRDLLLPKLMKGEIRV